MDSGTFSDLFEHAKQRQKREKGIRVNSKQNRFDDNETAMVNFKRSDTLWLIKLFNALDSTVFPTHQETLGTAFVDSGSIIFSCLKCSYLQHKTKKDRAFIYHHLKIYIIRSIYLNNNKIGIHQMVMQTTENFKTNIHYVLAR